MWRTLTLGSLSVGIAIGAQAGEALFDHGSVFTLIEENDLVVKTDRHYTQGIKLSYFHEDDFLPLGSRWLSEHLPQVGFENVAGRLGYSVGQNIYTPANIDTPRVLPNDRPYAGWLYVGAILQRHGWNYGDRLAEEDMELETGVICPWALAGEAQTWVHQLRDFNLPQGWRHQLHNEPGVRLKYSRAIRVVEWEKDGFGFDLTPRSGVSLGNVDTSYRAGFIVRVGYHLPDDFGYHIIDSLATTSGGVSKSHGHNWGVYGFGGLEGRAVFYTEFLDGNVFHESQSLQKEWFVGDAVVGFVVTMNQLEFGYAQTFRTPEFRGQTAHDAFGSVFVKARF